MWCAPKPEFFIPPAKLPTRIERALGHLTHIGDHQLVIQLVEHWHTIGQPTPIARLAAIRALIKLCQMDRSWARLRELLEEYPNWVAVQITAAELFLQRGWPKQARKPLSQAYAIAPDHPKLLALQARMREQDIGFEKVKDGASIPHLIEHARFLLSTGSSLKGQALLNQLRKSESNNSDITQLLWALTADYSLNDRSLWSHYAENDHDYETLADLGDAPDPTEPGASTPTEDEVRAAQTSSRFADLFLHETDHRIENTQPDEQTDSIELADLNELEKGAQVDFIRLNLARDGDTQIRRVLSKGQNTQTIEDQRIHSNLPDNLANFDFNAFRREMGMNTDVDSDFDDVDDVDPLEAEDADVIILVRQEPRQMAKTDDLTSEWLAPDPTTADRSDDLTLLSLENSSPQEQTKTKKVRDRDTETTAVYLIPWVITLTILLTTGFLILFLISR